MFPVYDLWLPILLAGLATHIWSTLAWMVMPHHKKEWTRCPADGELVDLLGSKPVPPGQYVFPYAEPGPEMSSPEFKAKQSKCNGMLVIWRAPLNMGEAIGKTLAFFFLASFCIGYISSLAVPVGASFSDAFRFVTTAGILTHCFGEFPGVFWFRRSIAMDLVDKLIYAALTGAIFAAFWPQAAPAVAQLLN